MNKVASLLAALAVVCFIGTSAFAIEIGGDIKVMAYYGENVDDFDDDGGYYYYDSGASEYGYGAPFYNYVDPADMAGLAPNPCTKRALADPPLSSRRI